MARHTNSRTQVAELAGDKHPQPDRAMLLPLIRLLARYAAHEAWSASQAKDLTSHDQDRH
jgi:hypothetical protein